MNAFGRPLQLPRPSATAVGSAVCPAGPFGVTPLSSLPLSRAALLSAVLAMMPLTACKQAQQAAIPSEKAGGTANDPAVRAAANGAIMVDPALAGMNDANAVTSGAVIADGGVPSAGAGGTAADATADARNRAGVPLMRAPAPTAYDERCDRDCDKPAVARRETLGGLARQQASGACGADVRYDIGWAQRLPESFPVYPRAAVKEAAGVANGRCNVRVVNFQSRAGMQPVLDFYYTMARRNGFDAEHLLRGTEHYLGGTKGDEAFVIMARELEDGIVDVDLIASGGR